jgi:hypothetical protein
MVGSGATFRYDSDDGNSAAQPLLILVPNTASLWALAASFEQTLPKWQLQYGLAQDTLRSFTHDEIDRKSANDDAISNHNVHT